MKFEKIHITGFGVLQNQVFEDISPGLNIIEGANEAGKTTMLEFVRALFFGFAQRDKNTNNAQRYLPKGGGAHGGWALLDSMHNGRIRVDRIGDNSSSGQSRVQLLDADRDIDIEVLLTGADRLLYEQIFAFSLEELSDFSQSDQRVQNRIYAASSGQGSDALFNALKRTDKETTDIYRVRGRNQLLNKALSEYRDLQSQIRELSSQVEEYNSDRDQLLEHQQNVKTVCEKLAAIKQQWDTAKLHADVWEPWVQLVTLRNELQQLPAQPEFDETKASAMPGLKIKLQQLQEAIEEKQPRLKRVEEELEDCEVNDTLLQNAMQVKTLREQLGSYESTLRVLPLDKQKRENIQQEIKVLLEQLGPRWDEENAATIDTSREPRLQIQQWETLLETHDANLREAEQTISATSQQVTQQELSLQRLQKEIQHEFPAAPPEPKDLEQRAAALREADILLRKRETQQLRAEYLRKEITAAQNQRKEEIYLSASIPTWTLFVPLFLALLAGAILWRQPLLAVLMAGLFVIVSIILFVISRHQCSVQAQRQEREAQHQQQRANAMEDLENQLHDCEEEIHTANAQLQAIAQKWGWNLQSQTDHQQYFDKLLQDRSNRSRYDNLQDDAKRRLGDLEAIREMQKTQNETIDSLKSTFAEQHHKWNDWLNQHHLPQATSPRQTLELFDFLEKARVLLRDRDQQDLEIAAKQQQCDDFEQAANILWQKLNNATPEKKDLPNAIRSLSDDLEQHQKAAIHRKNLLDNKQDLQDELETQNNRLQETATEMEQILSTVGCADQSEFDNKVKIAQEREDLQQKCQELERILASHSAPGEARVKLEQELQQLNAQSVTEHFETAQAEYQKAEEEKSHAERLQGEWNNKIKQREQNEDKLTALLRQWEIQKSTIADLTHQWATAKLTHVLLDSTRERFERERQPAVIQRAGELMKLVTAGRYQSVLASRGLDAVELDEGELGRKPLSRWSRGTKEQFYLALRLAFIEDYCSQTHLEPLPVVMDDVLVHSDGYQRLDSASEMIANFAEKYQVLYFTCRPGDADVLSQAAPTAKRFRLERGKFTVN